MNKQFYQGDISIISNKKVEKMAEDIVFNLLPQGGLVVAEGESTGNRHLLVADKESEVAIGQDQFGYFVKVNKGSAILTHQEHAPQTIGVGIHWVGQQWEYSDLEEYKRVQD
jgi:hypothetical protein